MAQYIVIKLAHLHEVLFRSMALITMRLLLLS